MKSRIAQLGTLAIALVLFLASCSKYEEGPGISLRSKKSRLVGDWKMTSITTNGQNSATSVETDFFECVSGSIIEYDFTYDIKELTYGINEDGTWTQNGKYEITYPDDAAYFDCTETYTTESASSSNKGTWEFSDDKESLILTYDDSTIDPETWKIIELREKKMQLELTDGTDIVRLVLESN